MSNPKQIAERKIRDMLEKYDEEFDGNVWFVQGNPVISHRALERIAARADIVFKPPTILRAERDEAVILVTGAIGDNEEFREEWSIGEALIGANYKVSVNQAAYVWAMAEKRAKDRVILKLVSLHGLLYSEEEADEFKERPSAPATNVTAIVKAAVQTTAKAMDANAPETYKTQAGFDRVKANRLPDVDATVVLDALKQGMRFAGTSRDLNSWAVKQVEKVAELPDAQYDDFKRAYIDFEQSLKGKAA